jgi:hypothetical protein
VPDGDIVPVEIALTGAFDDDAKSKGITDPEVNSSPTDPIIDGVFIIEPSGNCKT